MGEKIGMIWCSKFGYTISSRAESCGAGVETVVICWKSSIHHVAVCEQTGSYSELKRFVIRLPLTVRVFYLFRSMCG